AYPAKLLDSVSRVQGLCLKEIEARENMLARLRKSKMPEADQDLKQVLIRIDQKNIRKIFPAEHVDFLDTIKRKLEDEDAENQVSPQKQQLQFIVIIPTENLLSSSETLGGGFKEMISGITDSGIYKLDLAYYIMDVVLILDEVSSNFGQMTSVTAMRGFHKVNNDILRDFVKVFKKVIALDAELTDRDVQIIKELRDDSHVIYNVFKPQEGHLVSFYENEASLKLKVINLVKSGKKMWIYIIYITLKAEDTESLHTELKDMGFIGMCISANSLELEKRAFARNRANSRLNRSTNGDHVVSKSKTRVISRVETMDKIGRIAIDGIKVSTIDFGLQDISQNRNNS
ncbi:hypothetical protein BX616_003889, partial [Lobosporangium transversale]